MPSFDLIIEVAGCPTVCRHCWVLGTPYAPLPLGDVQWVLESVYAWCDGNGIRFGAFPMHEVAAHPEAAGLIRLFAQHDWMESPFQPLTTTGVPLAPRDDWREVLAAAAETGTTVAWVVIPRFRPRSRPDGRAPGCFRGNLPRDRAGPRRGPGRRLQRFCHQRQCGPGPGAGQDVDLGSAKSEDDSARP